MKKHNHRTLHFRRHFRIYLKNNHPAYIVDEEGNLYVFHRITHSETSGGKKNIPKANPLVRDTSRIMYIVKKEQRDKKNKFSLFELDVKKGFDISYPDIKKVGCDSDTGNHQAQGRSRYESSNNIKSVNHSESKKK